MRKILLAALLAVMSVPVFCIDMCLAKEMTEYTDEIVSEITYNQQRYRYGQRQYVDGDIDGLFQIVDLPSEETIRTIITDEGGWEYNVYLAMISESTLVLVTKAYATPIEYGIPEYLLSVIRILDLDGNLVTKRNYTGKITDCFSHGGMLVVVDPSHDCHYLDNRLRLISNPLPDHVSHDRFQYLFQGQAFVNGIPVTKIDLAYPGEYLIEITERYYRFAFSIRLDMTIENPESEAEYNGAVMIDTLGDLVVDGNDFASGGVISAPGNHRLVIYGEGGYERQIDFVILPIVENVEPGALIEKGVRIFSNAESMALNGEPYSSQLIIEAGSYSLDVFGVNGFRTSYTFTVLPSVIGVADGETYENEIGFALNCLGLLNGRLVSGDILIDCPGQYELVLLLEDRQYGVIYFTIIATTVETDKEYDYTLISYVLTAIAGLGLLFVFKKK